MPIIVTFIENRPTPLSAKEETLWLLCIVPSDAGSKVINAFEKGFKDLENRHNKNSETILDIKNSVSKITNTSQKIQNLDLENKKIGEQK